MLLSALLFAAIIGFYLLCGLIVFFAESVITPSKAPDIKPVLPNRHSRN